MTLESSKFTPYIINKKEVTFYNLTYPQKAIWYIEKLHPGTSISNNAGTLRIKEKLDYKLLEKAINIFVEKNDAFRLRIIEENGQPKQYISDYTYIKVPFYDFSKSKNFLEWADHETQIPFNLIDSDLFYFAIIKVADEDFGFYVKEHHLISDAWTNALLGSQVYEYYFKLKNGEDIPDIARPSYIDFILSEHEYEISNRFEKNKIFWDTKFQAFPEFTSVKSKISNNIETKAARKTFIMSRDLVLRIQNYCKESKTTVYSLFLSIASVYINLITTKTDIVIGTPILNRANAKEKNTSGMFINVIPLRLTVDRHLAFSEHVETLSRELISYFKNQKYPYDLILREFREKHKTSANLYDILISYQNARLELGTLSHKSQWHFSKNQVEPLIIHINDRDGEGIFILDFDYLISVFSEEDIEKMYTHISNLLMDAIENPHKKVHQLEMLSHEEKHQLLHEFNNTKAIYPEGMTIHQLFEAQAVKSPDNIAAVFEDSCITYRQLDERSNQLARVLRQKGVMRGNIVGIMLKRSIDMVIGVLGILKAGGAYLPIDTIYPPERINYMLRNSEARILLSHSALMSEVSFDGEMVDIYTPNIWDEESSALLNVNSADDLLYVIYTSGTTGTPKGVMLEHKNIVNLVAFEYSKTNIDFTKKVLQFTNISFDVCYQELFSTLLCGGTLYIIDEDKKKNIPELFSFIRRNSIDILFLPTAFLKFIASEDEYIKNIPPTVKHIITAGEQLLISEQLKKYLKENDVYLHNHYGPSETHAATTYTINRLNIQDVPPIGKPISNAKIYILDKDMNLVPIGVAGELYVSGTGVGKGYINRPELTAEKFVPNPFNSHELMYKTGDLARWLSDGNIEYLGRIDHQVKIRGFRVELGEIEAHLLKHPAIKEAIVIAHKDASENNYLCAYISSDCDINVHEIKTYLSRELPSYMIPAYFVKLEKLPLTPNGKVDRVALDSYNNYAITDNEYIEPRDDIERKLVKIWCETLDVEKIGINHDFFDIGGNSLKATTLIFKMSKEFDFEFPMSEIFRLRTIEGIAKYLKETEDNISYLKDSNLVLIRRGHEKGRHLFLIHAGEGEIDAYVEFCNSLNDDFNCWGIRADRLENYSPKNIDIETLAHTYIEKIKLVQPHGPYHVAGWCIGGTIAFEIARQLEQAGLNVKFLSLIDTPSPREWGRTSKFSLENESQFIRENLPFIKIDDIPALHDLHDIGNLWEFIIDYLESNGLEQKAIKTLKRKTPPNMVGAIPHYSSIGIRTFIYFINIIRTLHTARTFYSPFTKLMTQVHFFKASTGRICDKEEYWNRYCVNSVRFYKVVGDHFSIFKKPYTVGFAKMFENVLENNIHS